MKEERRLYHILSDAFMQISCRKWMGSNSLHTKRAQTASHLVRFKNPKEPAYLLFSAHAPGVEASHFQMADLNSSLDN